MKKPKSKFMLIINLKKILCKNLLNLQHHKHSIIVNKIILNIYIHSYKKVLKVIK